MPKVNPEIVRWAREEAGLPLEDAANGLGMRAERLASVEAGEVEPTRAQIKKMGERYRRALLTFYLPRPPAQATRTHDFRTLRERNQGSESLLTALVREIKVRQGLVRDALEDMEEDEPLAFVGSLSPSADPLAIAEAMKKTLHFDLDNYRRQRTIDDAFKCLRGAVEGAGVFVILMGNLGHHTTNVGPRVFRGLALADPVAPFIVVNENDSRSAWSFTLLHELAHVFLGQTGISGYNSTARIERLCDQAAAAFLLRPDELREINTGSLGFDELIEKIGLFAANKKVSRRMVAYNLMATDRIDPDLYNRLAARFEADQEATRQERDGSGPDYYVVRRHRIGRGLGSLVERMVSTGAMSSVRAARVLGVKPTAVGRMLSNSRAA